ncbi:MAG: tetratricopeptide repeat protein [Pseudomonadales bacterium]|nr:tetratricopeptide repeat protein [Pseudomonadales bacterium]
MSTNIKLDVDELFFLAIKASEKGDHEKAILYLKEGSEIEGSARFYYLLGAEHAEIGMYDRAIEEIQKALDLEPTIWEGWFQLGLLNSMLNNMEKAEIAWKSLDQLGENNPLYFFKTSILLASQDKWVEAEEWMNLGLEKEQSNLALANDMRRLLEQWQQKRGTEKEETESKDSEEDHLFLSAYKSTH